MCRYTSTNLSSTECHLFRAGGLAHQYTKWIYWLCRDAHNNQPCGNISPKEDQIGNDFGSRQGACPVCENIRAAEEKYKWAVQRATEMFNATVKRAYDTQSTELDEAKYVVETYPHRSSRGYHYHHRHKGWSS